MQDLLLKILENLVGPLYSKITLKGQRNFNIEDEKQIKKKKL